MPRKKQRTLSALKREASRWLSRAIRYESANQSDGLCTCITCGVKRPPNRMQAGHFLDGSNNSTRFIEGQILPQCFACNVLLNGNKVAYFIAIEKMYGRGGLNALIELNKRPHKFDRVELEQRIERYKARAIKAEERWIDGQS